MRALTESSPSPPPSRAPALLAQSLATALVRDRSRGSQLRAAAVCVLLVALAAAIGLVIERLTHVPNILLVFLPVVLFAAVRYGLRAPTSVSALSIAVGSGGLRQGPNILLVVLPVVLFAAVRYGFWAATCVSALSIAVASYFTEPVYSFAVSDPANVWALLMFMVVAAFTSSLAAQIRQRAAVVAEHGRVLERLRSEEHTSELQSREKLVCRFLLE